MTALATQPETTRALKPLKNGGDLRDLLISYQSSIADVLPKHLTPERMIKLACIAAGRSKGLLKCTQASIIESVMKSAELGLDCSGTLGEAYLIPYKDQCQFIVGYQGLIKLARNSGEIVNLNAVVVHKNDTFRVRLGTDSKIEHEPCYDGDRGEMVAVYAVANFRDGGHQFDVMTKADVDAIRRRSKASGSGPWVTDYHEMARKTVVRRLCKYLPKSQELQKAMESDAEFDLDDPNEVRVVRSSEVSATASLAQKLSASQEEPKPEPDPEPFEATNDCPVTAAQINSKIQDITKLEKSRAAICVAVTGMAKADDTLTSSQLMAAADALDKVGQALVDSQKPKDGEGWTQFIQEMLGA